MPRCGAERGASESSSTDHERRAVAVGRRAAMFSYSQVAAAASLALTFGGLGAGAGAAWAANEPVDPATSPLVQGATTLFVRYAIFLGSRVRVHRA